jgi:pimeloyl-ACP methyl ester carboxylesterase
VKSPGALDRSKGMARPRRRWLRILGVLALLYGAVCLLMALFEESLLFHPTALQEPTAERLAALPRVEPLAIEASDGVTLRGFFVAGQGAAPRPTLIYFGGNAEPVWRRARGGSVPSRFNGVYVSYRGYDRSGGETSAEALLADALEVHDQVARRPDVAEDAIAVWGTSLGSGMATHVAAERSVAAVVLFSPYDRLAAVAAGHYPWLPVSLLMRNDIDSAARAPAIRAPALIVHGDADSVIPFDHGERLADEWGGWVELRRIEGAGHNDLESRAEARAHLQGFLQRVVP